jgi:hypothetical protein
MPWPYEIPDQPIRDSPYDRQFFWRIINDGLGTEELVDHTSVFHNDMSRHLELIDGPQTLTYDDSTTEQDEP